MKRRAFTLLEVLVAVGMLVLLAGGLALFLEDLGRTRAHAMRAAAQTRTADAVFGAVETALQTAVVDGGAMGAGIAGGEGSLRLLSSRTDAGAGSVKQLARAAFAPLSRTEIAAEGSSLVVRRGGASSTLPASVRALQVRFLGEDGWTDSFDSLAAGALPRAVEVSIWFGAPAPAEESEDEAQAPEALESRASGGDGAESMVDSLGPPDRQRVFAVPDAGSGAGS